MRFILSAIISIIITISFTQAYAQDSDDYTDNLTGMMFRLVTINENTKVYIGMYEVKQGEWLKVVKQNPSHFKKGANYPVENVTSAEARKFISQLRAKTGIAYRLPSTYEWNEAAGEPEFTDPTISPCTYANFYDNTSHKTNGFGNKQYTCDDGESYTAAAGSYFPNGNGLYDMFGNVAEWCCNPYSETIAEDVVPYGEVYCKGFDESGRYGIAGGNFSDGPNEMSTFIKNAEKAHKFGGLGFRLAIDAEEYEGEIMPKQIEQ